MKIVLISDTHGFHRDPHLQIPDGDLLIHCGDLTMAGEHSVLWDVNEWFGELQYKFNDIIVIGGNHDRSLGGEDNLGFKLFTNAIYLEESSVKIDDKIIWGSPQTPWNHEYIANYFAFGKLRDKITWNIPKDTDIIVSHGPPYGYGDLLAEGSSDPNTHIGDKKLLDKINEIKPELTANGHIHEGYGTKKELGTTFVNCSVVDEKYNLVNDPIIVNL